MDLKTYTLRFPPKFQLLHLFFFLPFLLNAQALEDCNNGMDDDGDGLIDCYDTDCTCTGQCDDFYYTTCNADCYYVPPCGQISLGIQWTSDAETGTYSPLVAGDMDADGIPEVVTTRVEAGDLYIIDGATGLTKVHVINPNTVWPGGTAPAIADLDHDGFGEVVIVGFNRRMYCYEHTGALKWTSNPIGYNARHRYAVPNIADFDNNGWAEVNVGNQVYNGQTGTLLASGGQFLSAGEHPARVGGGFSFASPVAIDVLPDNFCFSCAGLEIVAGNQVLSVNLTTGLVLPVVAAPAPFTDGFTSVADIDRDGDLDAIVQGRKGGQNTVYCWEIETGTILREYKLLNNWQEGASRVNVADLNGDGDLEINFVSHPNLYALRNDFTPLWINPIFDASSITCTSIFDFCGDGSADVVYRSESKLQVIEGATGNITWEDDCLSATHIENPLILDVDNDGQTEIVIECGTNGGNQTGTVVCYEAIGTPGIASRPVWNQHAYFNTNINDDLSVPRYQQNPHIVGDSLRLNGFLNQYFNATFPSPDGVISFKSVSCDQDSLLVTVEVCNVGDNIFPQQSPVSVYMGNPQTSAAQWFSTFPLGADIALGACQPFTFRIPRLSNDTVFFVLNDDHSLSPPFSLQTDFPITGIGECGFKNNITSFYFQYQPATLELGQDTLLCANESVLLDATGNALVSWLWSDGASTATLQTQGPGMYGVTATDVCQIQQTDSILIGTDNSTVVNIGLDQAICSGATVNLGANGYDFYQWTSATNLSCTDCDSVALNPATSTLVILEAGYSTGCSGRDTVSITVHQTYSRVVDTTVCFGNSVLWNGQNIATDSSHLFDFQSIYGCDSTVLVQVHGTLTGTYNEIIDTFICQGSSLTINSVTLEPDQEQSFSFSSVSGCDSTVLIRVHASTLGTYQITIDTSICQGSSLTINNVTLFPEEEETFEFSSISGCDSTVLIRVHGSSLGTYNITVDTAVCLGTSLMINNVAIAPETQQSFNLSSVTGCDSTVLVRVAALDTFYLAETREICYGDTSYIFGIPRTVSGNYEARGMALNGCDSTIAVSLFVLPQIQLEIDGTVACFAEANASVKATVTNGIEPLFYVWNIPGNHFPEVNGLLAGDYSLTVTDGNNCTETETITLEQYPQTFFTADEDSVSCYDVYDGAIHIHTDDPTLLFQFNGDPYGQVYEHPNLHAGTYYVVSQDIFGCTDTVALTILQPPKFTVALPADTTVQLGASVPLNIDLGGLTPVSWIWNDSSYLSCLNCLDPVVETPLHSIRYTLSLQDIKGCIASDEILIQIEQSIGVYIPNAMGSNASLVPGFNPAVRRVNLFRIYDRWGQLLHEARNVLPGDTALSWDGRFRGDPVNPGVYVWQIELELIDGNILKKVGDLTVVR